MNVLVVFPPLVRGRAPSSTWLHAASMAEARGCPVTAVDANAAFLDRALDPTALLPVRERMKEPLAALERKVRLSADEQGRYRELALVVPVLENAWARIGGARASLLDERSYRLLPGSDRSAAFAHRTLLDLALELLLFARPPDAWRAVGEEEPEARALLAPAPAWRDDVASRIGAASPAEGFDVVVFVVDRDTQARCAFAWAHELAASAGRARRVLLDASIPRGAAEHAAGAMSGAFDARIASLEQWDDFLIRERGVVGATRPHVRRPRARDVERGARATAYALAPIAVAGPTGDVHAVAAAVREVGAGIGEPCVVLVTSPAFDAAHLQALARAMGGGLRPDTGWCACIEGPPWPDDAALDDLARAGLLACALSPEDVTEVPVDLRLRFGRAGIGLVRGVDFGRAPAELQNAELWAQSLRAPDALDDRTWEEWVQTQIVRRRHATDARSTPADEAAPTFESNEHAILVELRHPPAAPAGGRGIGRTANEQLAAGLRADTRVVLCCDLLHRSVDPLTKPERVVLGALAQRASLDSLAASLAGRPAGEAERARTEAVLAELCRKGAVRAVAD